MPSKEELKHQISLLDQEHRFKEMKAADKFILDLVMPHLPLPSKWKDKLYNFLNK